MATLYRNFARRRKLLEALHTDEVDAVCEAAGAVDGGAVDGGAVDGGAVDGGTVDGGTVEGGTPGAVLAAWLHRFFAFVTSKRPIASKLLEHTDRSNPLFDDSRARVIAAGRPLLAAAQAAHEAREDVALEQLLDMVIAIATIHGDTRYLGPILQTALDGLRPPTDMERA
jgi:hypothetical protein